GGMGGVSLVVGALSSRRSCHSPPCPLRLLSPKHGPPSGAGGASFRRPPGPGRGRMTRYGQAVRLYELEAFGRTVDGERRAGLRTASGTLPPHSPAPRTLSSKGHAMNRHS